MEHTGPGRRFPRLTSIQCISVLYSLLAILSVFCLSEDLWPHKFHFSLVLVLPLFILILPVLLAAFILCAVSIHSICRSKGRSRLFLILHLLFFVFASVFVIYLNISQTPSKIAFNANRDDFEKHLKDPPTADESLFGFPLEERIGPWSVESYASDEKDGIYFVYGKRGEGMGIDTMVYGITYRPDPKGTPYGAARYQLTEIEDDWYVFKASNDWFE